MARSGIGRIAESKKMGQALGLPNVRLHST
jgi:hypothetical protein